ncbi:hypothetical protein C0993_002114 [Termitomyces sp. T159_Od127]|nr:hypothetical protein C0993_002114 [Termitomyces sp. T159_Od127]
MKYMFQHLVSVHDNSSLIAAYSEEMLSEVSTAVRDAWKTNYIGNSNDLLREAMNDMYIKSSKKPYGNFCPIIQGSSTGKSWLVDKLSRSVFAIPIILRPDKDKSGFPPGDIANGSSLVNFFCGFKFKPALYVQHRYLLFLLKVISFASEWINLQIASGCGTELLAAKWQDHIGLSQSKECIAMYTTAIDMSLLLKGLENILDESIQFNTIQVQVRKFVIPVSKKIKPARTVSEPAIMFYFDEAHHLTKTTVKAHVPKRTAYQCLCKALTYMMSTPVVNDKVSFSKMIPMVDFLHALVLEEYIGIVLEARPRNLPGKTLEEAFKDGFVHFMQFFKAGDKSTITNEGTCLLFVRAAAIQGSRNMNQAGLLIPVWIPHHHNNDKPDKWSMTTIFIQVKNRVNNAFTFINVQKTFQFFSQKQGHEEHPYITIAMDLEVLASQQPEQESMQESKAKGKGENSLTTSFKSNFKFCPKDPGSHALVETFFLELQQTLRKMPQAHSYPCYEISITGCSKKVYNVIGEVSYSNFLAHKDMLTEHSQHGKYLDAVWHTKPYWGAKLSYD